MSYDSLYLPNQNYSSPGSPGIFSGLDNEENYQNLPFDEQFEICFNKEFNPANIRNDSFIKDYLSQSEKEEEKDPQKDSPPLEQPKTSHDNVINNPIKEKKEVSLPFIIRPNCNSLNYQKKDIHQNNLVNNEQKSLAIFTTGPTDNIKLNEKNKKSQQKKILPNFISFNEIISKYLTDENLPLYYGNTTKELENYLLSNKRKRNKENKTIKNKNEKENENKNNKEKYNYGRKKKNSGETGKHTKNWDNNLMTKYKRWDMSQKIEFINSILNEQLNNIDCDLYVNNYNCTENLAFENKKLHEVFSSESIPPKKRNDHNKQILDKYKLDEGTKGKVVNLSYKELTDISLHMASETLKEYCKDFIANVPTIEKIITLIYKKEIKNIDNKESEMSIKEHLANLLILSFNKRRYYEAINPRKKRKKNSIKKKEESEKILDLLNI